jgi:hypothetical protein
MSIETQETVAAAPSSGFWTRAVIVAAVLFVAGGFAYLLVAVSRVTVDEFSAGTLREMDQLVAAVEKYEERHGSLPPSQQAALIEHLGSLMPARDNALDLSKLDAAETLVFCLSGFRTTAQLRSDLTGSLYPFERRYLVDLDHDGFAEYVPHVGKKAPFVYFAAPFTDDLRYEHPLGRGIARPFPSSDPFQIVSAGSDGKYGDRAGKALHDNLSAGPSAGD